MKYLAFAMKLELILIGLIMMYMNPINSSSAFMTGASISTIGLYLALQGYFGDSFSGCILKSSEKTSKLKSFFKR